jgi:hypothetical protein
MKTRMFLLLLGAVVPLAGCSDPKSSAEYRELDSAVNEISSDLAQVEADIADAESSQSEIRSENEAAIATLKTEEGIAKESVSKAETDRNTARDLVSSALMDPSVRRNVIVELVEPACENFAFESQAALGMTDDDDERNRMVAEKIGKRDIYWWVVSGAGPEDPAGIRTLAEEFAPQGDACWSKGSNRFFDECSKFDRLLLKKDPESFKGKCLQGRVKIAQMDSNTGPCSFQGYLDGDYDVRTQFGMVLDLEAQSAVRDCSWAGDLKEEMTIDFWAFGLGSYSYSTTSGGTQTVPAFRLLAFR